MRNCPILIAKKQGKPIPQGAKVPPHNQSPSVSKADLMERKRESERGRILRKGEAIMRYEPIKYPSHIFFVHINLISCLSRDLGV